ncbi:hypothetical protein CK820_G0023540 [Pan troglodytes]|uniref:Uncharacterized protein n=1 Tax=Pan troglodytes TaxID=9598 RepID=A0A2J8M6C2_PANTR|nr:hypothetical protein CK820_G0023540 [Pan troglodytes]
MSPDNHFGKRKLRHHLRRRLSESVARGIQPGSCWASGSVPDQLPEQAAALSRDPTLQICQAHRLTPAPRATEPLSNQGE